MAIPVQRRPDRKFSAKVSDLEATLVKAQYPTALQEHVLNMFRTAATDAACPAWLPNKFTAAAYAQWTRTPNAGPLFVYGAAGVGKTLLAGCTMVLYSMAVSNGQGVRVANSQVTYAVLRDVLDAFATRLQPTNVRATGTALHTYRSVGLLVIDDILTGYTPADLDGLTYLLNIRRNLLGGRTMLCSRYPKETLCKSMSQYGRSMLDAATELHLV